MVIRVSRIVPLLIVMPILLLGLYFQSRYPDFLTQYFVFITFLTILITSKIDHPSHFAILFVILGIVVAMAMPAFFSKMPLQSFSGSFYVLAGVASLILMNRFTAMAVFWALVAYSILDTLLAFYQMVHLSNPRPSGLFMDANVRASFVLISILFVFWQQSELTKPKFLRPVLAWLVLILLLAGFHSAQSRAMLGLGGFSLLAIWAYALFVSPEKRLSVLKLTVAATAGFFIFLAVFKFSTEFGSQVRVIDSSVISNIRFAMWGTAWELIKEQPFFGHGYGMFQYLYPAIRTEMGTSGDVLHNDFLEYWLASGLPGLIFTLIPVVYFSFKIFSAFATARYQQAMFAGIGLCLMGFAFFNYFFWRIENLIVLAAVWKMTDNEEGNLRQLVILPKHRFIVVLIFLLPMLSAMAKVKEDTTIVNSGGVLSEMTHWSDWILVNESQLIPLRVRWNFVEVLGGDDSKVDYNIFNQLLSQLDSEISRGTLFPSFYCARAEVSFLLKEPYEVSISYIEMSEKLNPYEFYCAYAKFNISLAYKRPELALADLNVFLSQRLPGEKLEGEITLSNMALELAIELKQDSMVSYYRNRIDDLHAKKASRGF